MTRKLRVAIVGYGVAGISAAILLRRLGHEVVHFERAAAPGFGGAGLLLNTAGLAVLDRLGLRGAAMLRGAMVSRVYGETLGGSKVMDLCYENQFSGNHGLGIQRSSMLELLRAADEHAPQLQTSRQISAVDAEQGYLFDRSRGRLGPFDLIVAADGASSTIRAGLNALVRHDRPYRWSAVVCLLDDPYGIGGDRVLQSFAGPRHVAIWPVGSREPGAPRRINVSMNTPLAQSESLQAAGVWKRHVAELCPPIVPLLDQAIRTRDLLLFTYRDVALRRYYLGRVALIGDAAHSMSPQLGQGASLALLDSWALAQALERSNDRATALAEFDRERRAQVSGYQRISRWMTPMFQSDSRILAVLRDRAFYPLSRVPFVRGSMLRTLSGRRNGFFGTAGVGFEDPQ
jgi:FAD-dependent urate hydroxylase